MQQLDPSKVEASAIDFTIEELIPYIQPYREKYTKDGAIGMLPHISIIYPFFRNLSDINNNLSRLEKLCNTISKIDISITDIGYFMSNEIMYFKPTLQEPILDVIKKFATEFIETPPYNGKISIDNLSAHITISSSKNHNVQIEKELALLKEKIPPNIKLNKINLNIKYDGKWINYKTFQL
ncbi:2'-5' RNA ligase family protein [Haliovirga abyssi]|uniref:2'-5' RNA ligase family protein n=1 Tax=Haliovirga abyssi TaxID=2996794 RepID=A0AAU9D408_9FUSO|nr:2'-5' RNA ligase family protein [Haliovirga abyssi]BDU50704.1 hypothetical protein HLVA_12730 [Haliovirga abyssi]